MYAHTVWSCQDHNIRDLMSVTLSKTTATTLSKNIKTHNALSRSAKFLTLKTKTGQFLRPTGRRSNDDQVQHCDLKVIKRLIGTTGHSSLGDQKTRKVLDLVVKRNPFFEPN